MLPHAVQIADLLCVVELAYSLLDETRHDTGTGDRGTSRLRDRPSPEP